MGKNSRKKIRNTVFLILITFFMLIILFFFQTLLASQFSFNQIPNNVFSHIKISLSIVSILYELNDVAQLINGMLNNFPFAEQIAGFEYYFILPIVLVLLLCILYFTQQGLAGGFKWNGIVFFASGTLMLAQIIIISNFYIIYKIGVDLKTAAKYGNINLTTTPDQVFNSFTGAARIIGIIFAVIGVILFLLALRLEYSKKKIPVIKKRVVKKQFSPTKLPVKRIKQEEVPANIPFRTYCGEKTYIFLSYAHKDMKTVFNIIDKLHNKGYRIWYDEGIAPGKEWPEVIGKRITRCDQFLLCMSPRAVQSRNVRNEINLAVSENKEIVVIYLDDTRLSDGLKLQIGSVQHINKYDVRLDTFFERLCAVLRR